MALFLKRMLTSPELLGPQLNSQKAFVIAVYSGIGEEAMFRGFLQPWFIQLLGDWVEAPQSLLAIALGILAASALFGLLHFPVVEELRPWTLFACAPGLLFGVLAAWSQCLAAPVLAHVLINWLNLKRLTELQDDGPKLPGPS